MCRTLLVLLAVLLADPLPARAAGFTLTSPAVADGARLPAGG